MYIGLCVEHFLLFSHFKQKQYVLTNYSEIV